MPVGIRMVTCIAVFGLVSGGRVNVEGYRAVLTRLNGTASNATDSEKAHEIATHEILQMDKNVMEQKSCSTVQTAALLGLEEVIASQGKSINSLTKQVADLTKIVSSLATTLANQGPTID
mmetsp:Transcript_106504/g.166303  ORF Transcript_106504/g.166303 Transcript_106504/m.166303 type:complete len:120 (+) Transcript_106504:72-431(+)